jgi:predicted protein tyrosine phosphatase
MFDEKVLPRERIYAGRTVAVLVLNRQLAGSFTSDVPYIVISITDPHRPEAELAQSTNLLAAYRLSFNDTSHLDEPEIAPYYVGTDILFGQEDAARLLNFVDKYLHRIDLIICHCEFGISRSAGVAAAISRILNDNDDFFFEHYVPNQGVYRTIMGCLRKRTK